MCEGRLAVITSTFSKEGDFSDVLSPTQNTVSFNHMEQQNKAHVLLTHLGAQLSRFHCPSAADCNNGSVLDTASLNSAWACLCTCVNVRMFARVGTCVNAFCKPSLQVAPHSAIFRDCCMGLCVCMYVKKEKKKTTQAMKSPHTVMKKKEPF